jgi:hypothetical protein
MYGNGVVGVLDIGGTKGGGVMWQAWVFIGLWFLVGSYLLIKGWEDRNAPMVTLGFFMCLTSQLFTMVMLSNP